MRRQGAEQKRSGEKNIRLSEDLLWGVHPVFEGLTKEPGRFTEIILQKDRRGTKIEEIIDMAREQNVKLTFVESLCLTGEGSSQVRHQGIIARLSETPLIAFDDLLVKLKARIASGPS
jgi:23S rRNA (guanosine2251-2'-O)-methyltransferase